MTLHKLWILKSQIRAAIMSNTIDLLPAMIETNGSKTASEDPNQRPEVEIYFHVVDNVIQWYFWMVWRRIRSWVRIRSRLAVGNWNMVFAGRICKIKAGSSDSSLHASCNVGPGKVSGKPSHIYGLRKFWYAALFNIGILFCVLKHPFFRNTPEDNPPSPVSFDDMLEIFNQCLN